MSIIRHRNIFFAITGTVVLLAVLSILVFGLRPGIDFTGGTLVEVRYEGTRPDAPSLARVLEDAAFEGFSLRESGTNGFTLRMSAISNEKRGELAAIMSYQGGTAHIDQLSEVGPTIGKELRNKALIALVLVLVCILLFIAFAFRKVSKPVSSWTYGGIALVALLHDVIVPAGFYAAIGFVTGAQLDTLFVTAILTILGFSIHDTIVVFDRVRENLRVNQEHSRKEDFAETAGRSLGQTFVRSVNTSLTVLFTLLVLYFVGPSSTQDFALTLLVGITAGTYSSIFLATPLLVAVEKWHGQKRK